MTRHWKGGRRRRFLGADGGKADRFQRIGEYFDGQERVFCEKRRGWGVKQAVPIIITPEAPKKSDSYSHYIKQGESKATIQLDITLNNEPVHFDVEIKDKGTIFNYTIDYKGKQYKNTEATELLKSFDLEYYADMIFSMQADHDVTELTPTERSAYLQRLLNFDFTEEKETINTEIDEINTALTTLTNAINTAKVRIEECNKNIKTIPTLTITKKEKDQFQTELTSLNEKLQSSIESQNLKSKDQTELQKKYGMKSSLEKELSSLVSSREQQTVKETEITHIKDRISELLKNDDKLQENKRAHKDSIEELKNKIHSIETETTKLQGTVDELKKRYALTEKSVKLYRLGKCPECGQDVKEHLDKEAQQHNAKNIEALLKEIDDELAEETAHLQSASTLLDKEKKRFADRTAELYYIDQQIMTEQNEESKLTKRLKEIEDIEWTDYDSLIVQAKTNISAIEADIRLLSQRISAYLIGDIAGINNSIKKCNDGIREYTSQLEKIKTITEENAKLEEQKIVHQQTITEKTEKTVVENKKLEVRKEALKLLTKDLPNYMIIKTCASLQEEMNIFIHNLTPDYSVKLVLDKKGTNFYYTKGTFNEKQTNAWLNSKMSSGFEKQLLTIAFKVALCKAYGLDLLILDEIDAASDPENAEILYSAILNGNFQSFVISHKPTLVQYIMDNYQNWKLYSVKNGVFKEATEL